MPYRVVLLRDNRRLMGQLGGWVNHVSVGMAMDGGSSPPTDSWRLASRAAFAGCRILLICAKLKKSTAAMHVHFREA